MPRTQLCQYTHSQLIYTSVPVYTQSVDMSDCLQLQLVVGDETGCCVAVFWNVMAPRFLN